MKEQIKRGGDGKRIEGVEKKRATAREGRKHKKGKEKGHEEGEALFCSPLTKP